MKRFDVLIAEAESLADKTISVDFGVGHVYAQASIAYSLIAIAQELKKFNDEADLERDRQELSAEGAFAG